MITIDKEFKDLIPPLTAEEYAQLEENCVREGIRDPLTIWETPSGNDETKRLADIGLGQVIQQRLYNAGYRSIRLSLFVNLDRCVDIEYLSELLRSADIAVEEKEKVRTRIRELRNSRLDGQLRFDEDLQVIVPINEDEFMEWLLADAI